MDLLARYTRTGATLDLQLLEIETEDIVHLVADAEAEQENEALIILGRAWAEQNGHKVVEIDPAIWAA
jgi:hypothetical protein